MIKSKYDETSTGGRGDGDRIHYTPEECQLIVEITTACTTRHIYSNYDIQLLWTYYRKTKTEMSYYVEPLHRSQEFRVQNYEESLNCLIFQNLKTTNFNVTQWNGDTPGHHKRYFLGCGPSFKS